MTDRPSLQVTAAEFDLLSVILNRFVPEREVWAFGSRARGAAKPFSDLDLAVLGEEALDIDRLASLNEALAESDLPWKVDVVDWGRTSPGFRQVIALDHVVVQPLPAVR